MSRINLLGGTYLARSLIASAQVCLNLYPEKNPEDAAAPFTHQLTPGLILKKLPNSAGTARGLYTATTGALFYVCGATVYFVDSNFGLTALGTLMVNGQPDTLTTPVAMQDNGNVLIITNGIPNLGWAINLQSGLQGQPVAFQLTGIGANGTAQTYSNVPLTGGTGTGATASFIQIAGGVIVDMQLGATGQGYTVGDVLTTNIGGLTGVTIAVTQVGAIVNAFAQITDPSFLGSVGIGYVDTFLGFNQPGTRNFYSSLSNITYAQLVGNTQGQPALGAIIAPGTGGTNGVYNNVPLQGGSGTGATANITVATSGTQHVVTVVALQPTGTGYNAGDVLTATLTGVPTNFQFSLVEINAAAFDPTFIAGKTGYPDLLSTVVNVHREWWLLGAVESTEVWYDAGQSGSGLAGAFPFQIMPGVFIQHGNAAPYSAITHDLVVGWIGVDAAGQGTVYLGEGYSAKRISTFAIEKILSTFSTLSDAIGMVYKQQDHVFFIWTFPTADQTLVYDLTENLWHTRAWCDPSTGLLHRIRPNCMAFAYGVNICADWQNGNVYLLDLNTFTDNGGPIVRQRGFPHLVSDGNRVTYDRLALDMDCGNGVPTSPSYEPLLLLEYSDDRGKTWHQAPQQSMGAQGEYLVQMIWHRLGMARDRVFRVSWSEPVFTAIQGAWLNVTQSET